MRPCFALAVLLLAASGASAQVSVSPGTLFYPNETEVRIQNTSSQSVTLDSLAIRFSGARAYRAALTLPAQAENLDLYFNAFEGASSPVGVSLDVGDVATFRIVTFDPCVVCRGAAGGGFGADTLLVYTDGRTEPDRVVIDLSNFVASEALPASASRLSVFPNPAASRLTVRTEARGDVQVFDALGRRVMQARLDGGDTALDVSRLAPGTYRVVIDGAEARLIVVR